MTTQVDLSESTHAVNLIYSSPRMHRVVLQKVMKGKIEPLDEWLAKVEMALQQQPLAAGAAEEESPPPPPQQAPPPPVAVTSMPKKRSNRHGQTIFAQS